MRMGRVRFARIPDFSADSIVAFVRSAAALDVATRIVGWLG